ncbi:hypothetical protein MVI01_69830 [Myxococcus virescens]|uniref:Uncharacterized protein n=1 Tax=Myxococcus virescens TaxID=83456 RepID=A0A511HRS7_9BACT|nr:hypothetical protein MVI01_69830 [Myxococcus virescens]SDD65055.1 hypothetical protein SAMN04488504_102124 [Myxococcus virescens]
MIRLLQRFVEWVAGWFPDSPSQWEYERRERHRIGNELVRQYRLRQMCPYRHETKDEP